jgi:hypothetical protein
MAHHVEVRVFTCRFVYLLAVISLILKFNVKLRGNEKEEEEEQQQQQQQQRRTRTVLFFLNKNTIEIERKKNVIFFSFLRAIFQTLAIFSASNIVLNFEKAACFSFLRLLSLSLSFHIHLKIR